MDDRYIKAIWRYVIIGIVAILALVCGTRQLENYLFTKGNYCEATLQGHAGTAWVKCPQAPIQMFLGVPESEGVHPQHHLLPGTFIAVSSVILR